MREKTVDPRENRIRIVFLDTPKVGASMNLIRFLSKRLRNIGVKPGHAKTWAASVQYQIDQMGPEGAVLYLKRVGECVIWAATGSGNKPLWVKTRNRYPVIFPNLEEYPLEIILRVAKLARGIVLGDQPTGRQVRKVVRAVVDPYLGSEDGYLLAQSCIDEGTLVLTPVQWDPTDYPTVLRQFRKVNLVGEEKSKPVSRPPVIESLELIKTHSWIQDLPEWRKVLYPLSDSSIDNALSRLPVLENDYVGSIHASQEGGAKLRMYASPFTVIQAILSPIHDFMDSYRRQLPTDCTYDQSSGAGWAQAQLKAGKTVHSLDLSTATCRFPLSLQLAMANRLGLPLEHIKALRQVSGGTWRVGKELLTAFPKTLQWVVGQPLGIRPSMSMFSLTHNLLLIGICQKLGVPWAESFRVLGDDVVINDDRVASMYTTVMEGIGVPISIEKSHHSLVFAEFAGYSITPEILLRPGQWRQVNMKNYLSIAEQLGSRLEGEVTFKWLQAGKLHLFREGKWTPPVESYAYWLRLNTMLGEQDLFPEFKSESPYWYYTVMGVVEKEFRAHKLGLPGFVPDTPCITRVTKSLPKDHPARQVETLIGFSFNPQYVVNLAIGYCAALDGNPDYPREVILKDIETIINKANAMLYQPPRDKWGRWDAMLLRYLAVIESLSGESSA